MSDTEDYPRDLMEFEKRFADLEACRNYLERLRWPQGFECPGCCSHQAWRTKRGHLFCRTCKRQTSVTAGTIFNRTKISLPIWFRAVWLVTNQKNGVSALGLQRQLGLACYETAWMMLRRLRGAMIRPGREALSGEVEVDETLVGGVKPGKRGRGTEGKELVVIGAEINGKKMGRIRMKHILHADSKTLGDFIETSIQKGAKVVTDGWRGYCGIDQLGYRHKAILGESVGVDELLPRVHQVASLLKRWLLGTHHGGIDKAHHLEEYLDEFTFRFNRRSSNSRGKLFYRLMQQTMTIGPKQRETVGTMGGRH
jgi:transposase-like protein